MPEIERMSSGAKIETAAGPAWLTRSNRSTLAISVLPDGALQLTAPEQVNEDDILQRVRRRLRWITKQRAQFAEMHRNRVPLRYESGATHTYLGRQYRLKVKKGPIPQVKLRGGYFYTTAKTNSPKEVQKLLEGWMRSKAEEQFSRRLEKWGPWCAFRQLPAPTLRLLKMPKRWGSAGQGGRIALNPELVRTPSICIDYVIAHEICHLQHPHHDRRFFSLLDEVFPNWKTVKARLEQFN